MHCKNLIDMPPFTYRAFQTHLKTYSKLHHFVVLLFGLQHGKTVQLRKLIECKYVFLCKDCKWICIHIPLEMQILVKDFAMHFLLHDSLLKSGPISFFPDFSKLS